MLVIIALDGPAGSGKSTTARAVAQRLGFLYLDTGAMYRAVALAVLRAGEPPTPDVLDALLPSLQLNVRHEGDEMRMLIGEEDVSEAIRQPRVGQVASRVGAHKAVRDKMLKEQRRIGRNFDKQGGVVLDGRDIGTVVFPKADLKIFMVADPMERARRRVADLAARGISAEVDEVLAEMMQRDQQDSERAIAPLRPADDAIELDTTAMSFEEQVAFVVKKARERSHRAPV